MTFAGMSAGPTELKKISLFKRLSAGTCPCREWAAFVSCFFFFSLSPSQVAGEPSSDGWWQGRPVNVEYKYVMKHCEGSCQVYGQTHCTVRWFPLAEAFLGVCCELEESRYSRVSGSEAVLIFSW